MLSFPVILFILADLAVSWYVTTKRPSNDLPLPPGPPKLPLIGNLHQAPKEWPWRTYASWAKTYGPIFTLQFGRDTIIMLSSHTTARDLLDKRSNIYSSRPHLVMGHECVSKGNRSLLMPYGPQYRKHQRVQGGMLAPRLAAQYTSLQNMESKQLIYELLTAGDDEWMDRFHRYSSSLIFGLAFGKRMPVGNEEEVKNIEQLMNNFLYSARVGTWIVDSIPILNKLPTFLAPWKRIGDQFHEFESAFHMQNLEEAQNKQGWNWAKEAATMKETHDMSTKEVAYMVGGMYEAGSDTTTIALHSFVMSALAHPDTYIEAQREVDKVVDETEFPTFDHVGSLPYVEAVAKEVLRWRPVSAGGIPHAVTKDDEYMGYRIPAGATVIGNHWAIDHDTEVYGPDASAFRPSRWMEDRSLQLASFGYGRRVCTGQHVAMNSLCIIIARLLWAFNIRHSRDENGSRVEVDSMAYTQGFNSGPLPFKAVFEVRSEKRRQVIEEAWNTAEKDVQTLLSKIGQTIAKSG